MDNVADFPEDILRRIASLLGAPELIAFCCTCTRMLGLLQDDACFAGSVNNLVYSGKLEENRYQVLKLSYAVLKSIRERSWDDSMRDLLQEAEAKNELSACAKEHHVHLGSQPAIGGLQQQGATTVVANTCSMVIMGSEAGPLGFYIPRNSPHSFMTTGTVFSPKDTLRLLAYACKSFSGSTHSKAYFGTLRQIFLDFRPQEPVSIWRGGSHLFFNIASQSVDPTKTVASIKRMSKFDLEHLHQLLSRNNMIDTLDISEFEGSDQDILQVLHHQSNISCLIAQHTNLGFGCFSILGNSLELPGSNMRKLDISGCDLNKGATMALLSCLKRLVHLQALGLSGTKTGALFHDVRDSGFAQVLQRLLLLDVAHVHDMTAVGLKNILTFSPGLRTLLCHDCMPVRMLNGADKAILLPSNSSSLDEQPYHHQQQHEAGLPSFHHLSCGWGFGTNVLKASWGSSPWLVTFRCSIGATISNCALAHLANSCPHLQELAIESAPVCSQGISHVLRGCPVLHTLQLLRCSGPFEDEMVSNLSSLHRVGMREVCIVWGSGKLTDAGLGKLIGTTKPSLEHLELVGCRYLTDNLLNHVLKEHKCTLHTLRLEECARGPRCDIGLFSYGAICNFVQNPKLRQIRLRHSCSLEPGFAELLVQCCPGLEHLLVDQCDIPVGLNVVKIQHFGRLRYLQIAHCKVVKPLLQSTTSEVNLSGALGYRRTKKGVMIHDLLRKIPYFVEKN